MKIRLLLHFALAGLLLGLAARAPAQDVRETGRQLAKKYAQAIIRVKVVVNITGSYGGQSIDRERTSETPGTVLTPDGLTIVPLSAVDISRLVGASNQNKIDSRVKDIKLIMGKKGGKSPEIPATVVLRDPDLNVAYLRPVEKPAQAMVFIDAANGDEPLLLDPCVVLARLSRVADREIGAMTGEIQSIMTKPRKFFIPSNELASGGMGVPVFTREGKLIGIITYRIGNTDERMMVVLLPAKDVKEGVDQAPLRAAETPAAEDKTEVKKNAAETSE